MYKKHIGHLIMVSMKYFFDLDYSLCHQLFMRFLLVPFIFRMLTENIGAHVQDSLLTVRQDISNVRRNILSLKDNLPANLRPWGE